MLSEITSAILQELVSSAQMPDGPATFTSRSVAEIILVRYLKSPYDFLAKASLPDVRIVDCLDFVVGPNISFDELNFISLAPISQEFLFGSLILYFTIDGIGAKQYNHIGITTPNGTIISKLGMHAVIEHLPDTLTEMYGSNIEYRFLSTKIVDSFGQEKEIYIMPSSSYFPEPEGLNLTITDGREVIGTIFGKLDGGFGQIGSKYSIFVSENLNQNRYPNLIEDVINFLRSSPLKVSDKIVLNEA